MAEITQINFSVNNLPEGLDPDLIKKRDELIQQGKIELRSILERCDPKNMEQMRKVKPILAAKKGAYSRKFFQFAKEIFLADLFQRNNIPVSFKNYNFVSMKVFGESLDKSLIARLEKDTKYGKGVQQALVLENEHQVVDKLQLAISLVISPHRETILKHLAYDNIHADYTPEQSSGSKHKLKI